MAISLNYRFLLHIGCLLVVASALLGVLLLLSLGHHEAVVPIWGQQSLATDLVIFSLAFGFLISWVATKLTHRALQEKRVLPLHWHLKSQTLIDRLPQHILQRALMLGLAGVVIAGIMLLLFRIQHIKQIPYAEYIPLFAVYAISLAAAITTMSFYRALGDDVGMRRKMHKKGASTL